MANSDHEPAGECKFCGKETRAGGPTLPHRVRNSEMKKYWMLCPVAVAALEELGLYVSESTNGKTSF